MNSVHHEPSNYNHDNTLDMFRRSLEDQSQRFLPQFLQSWCLSGQKKVFADTFPTCTCLKSSETTRTTRKETTRSVKCKRTVGTYIHCFWECRFISRFWSNVAQELSKIFSLKVTKDSGFFILGLPSKTLSLSRSDFTLCDKLLFLARRCILKQWISEKPPTVTQWYKETYKI